MIFRLAYRNLTRRPTQSFLAAGAVAGSLMILIATTNFQEGAWVNVVRDTVRAAAGHVVVQPLGYQKSKDPELLIPDSSALAKRLADSHPDTTVLRRIFVGGMIASPNNSVAVALNGVEPEAERAISQIPDKLKEGAWLQPDSDGEVLIGVTLAKRLQVSVGDKVVVTSSRKGELQGFPFRVAGTFEVGSAAMDAFFVLATLSAVQNLIPDVQDPATQVAIQVAEFEAPSSLLGAITSAAGDGFEVLPWEEALSTLYNARRLDRVSSAVTLGFLAILSTIGILNVLLMSLFQRTREMGMLQALGMRPFGLTRLLMAEGLLLGAFGVLLGLALGLAVSFPLVEYGFDYAMMQDATPVSGVAMDTHINGIYAWTQTVAWSVAHLGFAVLAALWPAVRAGRLEAVESLRAH